MGTLIYKDQSATELQLHVVVDRVDFQQFLPLAVARLEHRPQFQINAGIIGSSHIVQLSHTTQHVSEILACTALPTDVHAAFSSRITQMSEPLDLQLTPTLHYHFAAQQTDSQRGQPSFQALTQRIVQTRSDTSLPSSLGLAYSFPATRRGAAPQTLVWVMLDSASQRMTIKTAHSYPNEDTIILSDSWVTLSLPTTV